MLASSLIAGGKSGFGCSPKSPGRTPLQTASSLALRMNCRAFEACACFREGFVVSWLVGDDCMSGDIDSGRRMRLRKGSNMVLIVPGRWDSPVIV